MRCIECDRPAAALCPVCQVGQCETHLVLREQWQRRTGALAGCNHVNRPAASRTPRATA